jgi:predicted RNase H-like nuclease (RuvC/YqgF family)
MEEQYPNVIKALEEKLATQAEELKKANTTICEMNDKLSYRDNQVHYLETELIEAKKSVENLKDYLRSDRESLNRERLNARDLRTTLDGEIQNNAILRDQLKTERKNTSRLQETLAETRRRYEEKLKALTPLPPVFEITSNFDLATFATHFRISQSEQVMCVSDDIMRSPGALRAFRDGCVAGWADHLRRELDKTLGLNKENT